MKNVGVCILKLVITSLLSTAVFLRLRLTSAPARPARPIPSSATVVGSGIGVPVISPTLISTNALVKDVAVRPPARS